MTAALELCDDDAAILRGVLRECLPKSARAYAFGSRVHGGARRYSDLDLALEWDQPLGLDLIGQIAEALSESDLPCKVDIVDLSLVEPAFRRRIAADCIPLDVSSSFSQR
jgi:predicted nucleotidyltransferase